MVLLFFKVACVSRQKPTFQEGPYRIPLWTKVPKTVMGMVFQGLMPHPSRTIIIMSLKV